MKKMIFISVLIIIMIDTLPGQYYKIQDSGFYNVEKALYIPSISRFFAKLREIHDADMNLQEIIRETTKDSTLFVNSVLSLDYKIDSQYNNDIMYISSPYWHIEVISLGGRLLELIIPTKDITRYIRIFWDEDTYAVEEVYEGPNLVIKGISDWSNDKILQSVNRVILYLEGELLGNEVELPMF